jgi:hypothetical protein
VPQANEKEELSARAKGDVVAGLLPLVDNFELARTQVKPETEGEQKINNSYQVRPVCCTFVQLLLMHCLLMLMNLVATWYVQQAVCLAECFKAVAKESAGPCWRVMGLTEMPDVFVLILLLLPPLRACRVCTSRWWTS